MKKVLTVLTLDKIAQTVPKDSNAQVLGSRKGRMFWIQNFEFGEAVSVSSNPLEDELIIKIKMREGEHLVSFDGAGIAEQKELK